MLYVLTGAVIATAKEHIIQTLLFHEQGMSQKDFLLKKLLTSSVKVTVNLSLG